ncbi:Rab geranylgeranyltransferase, partial [Rhizina undulata]
RIPTHTPPEDVKESDSATFPELDPVVVNAGLKAAYEARLALQLKAELTLIILPLLKSFQKCYWSWNYITALDPTLGLRAAGL